MLTPRPTAIYYKKCSLRVSLHSRDPRITAPPRTMSFGYRAPPLHYHRHQNPITSHYITHIMPRRAYAMRNLCSCMRHVMSQHMDLRGFTSRLPPGSRRAPAEISL